MGGAGHPADAPEAVGHPGAGLLLEDVPDPVTDLDDPQERRERAQLHGRRGVAGEVVARCAPARRARYGSTAALGHLEADQLLHRQREADVVEHRRDVVEAVGVGEDLRSRCRARTTSRTRGAGSRAARRRSIDRLAVEVEHHADGAVHRRVRRAHVQASWARRAARACPLVLPRPSPTLPARPWLRVLRAAVRAPARSPRSRGGALYASGPLSCAAAGLAGDRRRDLQVAALEAPDASRGASMAGPRRGRRAAACRCPTRPGRGRAAGVFSMG